MDGSSTNASGRRRSVRSRRILALVAGGALLALAVLLQGSWRLFFRLSIG